MAFVKVHLISCDDRGNVRWKGNAAVNRDSINFCEETDISLKEEKWPLKASFHVIKLGVTIGEYATKIFLKNGETILVTEPIEYFLDN